MIKQEKYKVNDYSRFNECNTRKIAFSVRQLLHPKGTTKSSLAVSPVFPSSRLEPKRRKKTPTLKNARRACVTRLSHPHEIICLHTVIWFHVLLSNINDFQTGRVRVDLGVMAMKGYPYSLVYQNC